MKYSIEWLKNKLEEGDFAEYLFFWGHRPKQPGTIDKSCFSQWYPLPFVVDNTLYHTAEHWMMAAKARMFNDTEILSRILKTESPAVAKHLGREVKNFDPQSWHEQAYQIVLEGNMHKFSQHNKAKQFLMYTGGKVIVEASPNDNIWGIGLSQDAKEAESPFTWKGPNLLGFALMEVRERLKYNSGKAS